MEPWTQIQALKHLFRHIDYVIQINDKRLINNHNCALDNVSDVK